MRGAFATVIALVGVALVGCSEMPFVVVLNEIGAPFTLMVTAEGRRSGDLLVEPSRHRKVRQGWMPTGFEIRAGGCAYRYETWKPIDVWASMSPTGQVEPDVSVHLLAKYYEGFQQIRFIDDPHEG